MAGKSDGATPKDPQPGRRKRAKAADLAAGESPLAAPWNEGTFQPIGSEQAVMESLAPAVSSLLDFEHQLLQAILAPLAEADTNLQALDDRLRTAIGSALLPAISALSGVQNAADLAIRGNLADAASSLSGLTGEPVHLSEMMSTPIMASWPGQVPPNRETPGPWPMPVNPPNPVPAPPVIPPPNPPIGIPTPPHRRRNPSRPGGPPGVPMSPDFTGPQGGGSAISNAITQSTQSIQPDAGGTDASSGASKSPCIKHDVNDIGPNNCDWSSLTAALQYYDCLCSQDPTSGPFKFTYAASVYVNGVPTITCLTDTRTCADFPPAPTPTPPAPPTTPTPTTPTPTPTTPTPTPTTPTPTPTPQPIPTPVNPTPICPPGLQSVWNPKGYYTCEPIPTPIPLPPTPTPIGSPTPTPTPPIGGVAGCGNTKQNPCWEASNPPDEDLDYFNSTPGIVVRQADKDTSTGVEFPDVDALIPAGVNINDNISTMQECQFSYSVEIALDPEHVSSFIVDPDKFMEDVVNDVEQAPWGDRLMFWSWALIFLGVGMAIVKIYKKLVDGVVTMVGASTGAFKEIAASETAMGFLNGITFGGLRKIIRIQRYGHDYKYPTGLPSPSEAASAWLAASIDDCTFQTWVMAGDTKFEPFRDIVKGGKFKFSALELMTLNKREQLKRGSIADRMRELGSLEQQDVTELEKLFEQIPGPADLIRFMVRDTANQQVIQTFGLDDGFGENFNGQIQTWANYQGLTQEVMTHEWRAHWSIPSPTQLYEMLHRLRHDPDEGGPQQVESNVTTALKQQDILPFWIPKLMKISYHPLTRTDLNRAYSHGWIQDDDYVKGMYANGYSDDDAGTLLRFAVQERKLALRNSDFIKSYADGFISLDQMHTLAVDEGYDDSVMDAIDELADAKRKLSEQHKQVAAIAAQYKACRIQEDEATKDMQDLEIPEEVINYQLNLAGLATTCGTKREMQGTLCALLKSGDITVDQYESRMKTLKYDDMAIGHYLAVCSNQIAAKRKREQDAAAKKAEKEAEKELKQEQADEEKARKAAERVQKAAEAAERSRQGRNKALEDAAIRLGKNLTDVSGPPSVYVKGLWQGLQAEVGLSQNEAANVINMGSSKAKGMTLDEFTLWAYKAAETGLSEPWTLYPFGQG